jgi:hypothetical protein
MEEHIPSMPQKIMNTYVFPTLSNCATANVTFDLWMGQSRFDTFVLVVNFIDDAWVFKHVTIGFF